MLDLQTFINPLLALSRTAGVAICQHYDSAEAAEYEEKGDDSPLTRADLDSHAILTAGLKNLDSDIPILSEESTGISVAQRLAWTRYWLVDPLDGTREFLDRTGEFTINIALIDNHVPVLGLLYLPLEKKAYLGIPGVMACSYEYIHETWQAVDLRTRRLPPDGPLTVLAGVRHRGPRLNDCLAWLEERRGPLQRKNSGSALKFCQLADGIGDFYPRFSPCCEWDTGAGQALLVAAGGGLLGMDGHPVRYNLGESLYSPDFYAVADADNILWQELLASNL
ncbi:MAG: inositol monophosphatase family protein [Halioglobus sp.]